MVKMATTKYTEFTQKVAICNIIQALSDCVTIGLCDVLLFVNVLPIPDRCPILYCSLIGFCDLSDFVTTYLVLVVTL